MKMMRLSLTSLVLILTGCPAAGGTTVCELCQLEISGVVSPTEMEGTLTVDVSTPTGVGNVRLRATGPGVTRVLPVPPNTWTVSNGDPVTFNVDGLPNPTTQATLLYQVGVEIEENVTIIDNSGGLESP